MNSKLRIPLCWKADDLLICDADSRPQAIAGIMGGHDAEVTDSTTEILLEAAYFEPMGIARSSKRLKLRSESSARFERGIDPDGVAAHAERAMALFAEVASAHVAAATVDEYPRPHSRPKITLRTSKVNAVLGTEVTDQDVIEALVPIGIDVTGSGDDLVATPPSFRPDLTREIDLVEEVARRVGFAAIGRTVPKPRDQVGALTRRQRERRLAADALVGAGCSEAITIPLVSPEDLAAAGAPTERVVRAANPLRAEESVLRTGLLPGLLRAAVANHARGAPHVALFEIGRVFSEAAGKAVLPDERVHVAALLTGTVARRPVEADRPVDAYDAVDVARALLDALEIADVVLEPVARDGYHAGRTVAVRAGDRELGVVGEVAAAVRAATGLDGPAVAFELDLDAVLDAPRRDRAFVAPSPFPVAAIDLAFVLDDGVHAGAVVATLRDLHGPLLEDVRAFDEFRAEALGEGRRSVAFSLRFRAPDRTLTDQEVGDERRRAVDAVQQRHGGQLRE